MVARGRLNHSVTHPPAHSHNTYVTIPTRNPIRYHSFHLPIGTGLGPSPTRDASGPLVVGRPSLALEAVLLTIVKLRVSPVGVGVESTTE